MQPGGLNENKAELAISTLLIPIVEREQGSRPGR